MWDTDTEIVAKLHPTQTLLVAPGAGGGGWWMQGSPSALRALSLAHEALARAPRPGSGCAVTWVRGGVLSPTP